MKNVLRDQNKLFSLLLSGLVACAMACAGEEPPPPPKVPPPGPVRGPVPPRAPMPGPIGMGAQTPPVTPPDVEDMTNPRYLLDLARVHMQYNALSRAEELLRKALPLAKEPDAKEQVGFQLATLLQRKQDFKGAVALLEEIIGTAANPQMRNQWVTTLSDLYLQMGEPDKAEKLLNDQMALISGDKSKPEYAALRSSLNQRLANIWQRQEGRVEKERTAAEEASTKDPQNKELLEKLVNLYMLAAPRPDYEKAVGIYEKLLKLAPDDNRWTMGLATAYQQTKQYDKAIEVHKKLMAADPRGLGQSSAYQVATLLLQAGKKDEAATWAKEHLAGNGNTPFGQMMLANFYEQAGMVAEASEVLGKLREQSQQPQQKAEYSFRIARVAQRAKDYKKAEEELQKLLKEFPDDKAMAARANGELQRLKAEEAGGAAAPPTPPRPPTPPAK